MRETAGAPSGTTTAWLMPLADADEGGWELEAACRSEDPTMFFGPNRFEPKRERLERERSAKTICRACPVIDACRDHAVVHGELYGVWGGLGEAERRGLVDEGGVARSA